MTKSSSRTTLRLRREGAELIRPGLLRLIIALNHWQDRGAPLISPASFHSLRHRADEGRFSAEAPKPNQINPDEDPWEVIKCTKKVDGGNPNFVPEIINNTVKWLARWVQRVIPDRAIMEGAIDQARGLLLREARKAR